jgi:hypothetical protein
MAVVLEFPNQQQSMSRNDVIATIKNALQKRSGKTWSVTGGKGTAHGWLKIDAPPARRTWHFEPRLNLNDEYTEYEDASKPFGHMSPSDQEELKNLLGLERRVHHQGIQIPSGYDYYREYIARAKGHTPTTYGTPYWD